MTSENTSWPTFTVEPEWCHYDWHSGLYEITDDAVARYGFGVFGAWWHAFVTPSAPVYCWYWPCP